MILNLKFFVLSDFESIFFRFVTIPINFFTTRQILIWKFSNVSDFESTF